MGIPAEITGKSEIKGSGAGRKEGEEDSLAHSDYFCVRHRVATQAQPHIASVEDGFVHLLCLSGEGSLRTQADVISFAKGESIFLPAGLGAYTVSGELTWLESCV